MTNQSLDDLWTDYPALAAELENFRDAETQSKSSPPKAQKTAAPRPQPTEGDIDAAFADATSEADLTRRLSEAGVAMSYDGMPLSADGRSIDVDAPRYDAGGVPVNETAWAKYREQHPEYAELEANSNPRTVATESGALRDVV